MKRLLCLGLSLLLLTACTQNSAQEGSRVTVYYAALQPYGGKSAVQGEDHVLSGNGEPVEELMRLLEAPESSRLSSPLPQGVTVLDWSLSEGVLHLELSEGYGGLSGIDLTIADYCITLTLCQLEEVRSVIISVEGDLLPSRFYQALRGSDVLLSDAEDEPQYLDVELYFPNAELTGLVSERRTVQAGGGISRSAAILRALMKGPEGAGLVSLMPENARLLSAQVENGVCLANFSAELGQAEVASRQEGALLLYAMVDSLCRLPGVEEVQLLIEGEAPVMFGGVPTLKPLERDVALILKPQPSGRGT